MIGNHRKNSMIVIFLILFSWGRFCFSSSLSMNLSRDHINLGESTTVTYAIDNNENNIEPDFSALQKDFRILNTYYGNTINVVNGITTNQLFWRLVLEPKKAGNVLIPPIYFGNHQSTTRKLIVTMNQMHQVNINVKQADLVFVRGEISSNSPYVQSQLLYTFKLYFRSPISQANIEIPQDKNVIFLPLGNDQAYQATIRDHVYQVVEKKFAVFPKKPGTMTLLPIQFHGITREVNAGYNNDLFDIYIPKTIATATQDFNLSVRDIPSHYQGTTWLPAENIFLNEQWSLEEGEWETGIPVTRTIIMQAQGLRAEQLPDLTFDKLNGVNVYVDSAKRRNTIQNNTLVGVLEQKITYIPSTAQSLHIPPLKINWWNTKTNMNSVTQLDEKAFHVRVITDTSISSPPSRHPIFATPKMLSISSPSHTFFTSIWFWMACILLVTWIVTLFIFLRKKADVKIDKEIPGPATAQLTDNDFKQACLSGQVIQAQQFILEWAKKHWPAMPLNLTIIKNLVNDQALQLALEELEEVLYSRKNAAWNGQALFLAYQNIKKSTPFKVDLKVRKNQSDTLPPLNP